MLVLCSVADLSFYFGICLDACSENVFFFTPVVCCNGSSYPLPEMLSFSFCLLKTSSLKAQIALIGLANLTCWLYTVNLLVRVQPS